MPINYSEQRFRERMAEHAYQRVEDRKRFDEYQARKERAADPLVPMITDDEGEDDMEWARR